MQPMANGTLKIESPPHVPVLLETVLAALQPLGGEVYVDGTFGAGGYTQAILEAADAKVIALDRDPHAIDLGQSMVQRFPGRLHLQHARFSEMGDVVASCHNDQVDGVVLDLGVSSMQLDDGRRGFSIQRDGPLDMRMDEDGPTAADVVNACDEKHMADIFFQLGEEPRARAVARAIVAARREGPISTTGQLAHIVSRVVGEGRQRIHPATRVFQALRIYINRELEELANGLAAAETLLKPGGRLVVVAFHSLEDRVVKRFLDARSRRANRPSRHVPDPGEAERALSFEPLLRRLQKPTENEIAANPRARSARLRAARRTDAAALPLDVGGLGIPAIALEERP